MFGKNKNTLPIIPIQSSKAEQVLATLELSGLDPEHTLLVGSAALTLYGAELLHDPLTYKERPGDVDLQSTTSHAEALYAQGSYNNTPVRIKENMNNHQTTVLQLAAEPLPIDLITAPQNSLATDAYDSRLLRKIQSSPRIDGSDFRVLSLQNIIRSKNILASDPKAANDLASARDALARIKRDR